MVSVFHSYDLLNYISWTKNRGSNLYSGVCTKTLLEEYF